MRAEGWAKESRIDQGQELACEVSSDAVTKIKRFALANNHYNYYNYYRDCSLGRALLSRPLYEVRHEVSPLNEGGLHHHNPPRRKLRAGGHVSPLHDRGQQPGGPLQGRQVPLHLAVPAAQYDVFAERCCHACALDASHEFRLHTLSNCSSSSEEQSVVCLHQDQHPATLLIPVDSSREEKNLPGDTTDSIATTRAEDTWSRCEWA